MNKYAAIPDAERQAAGEAATVLRVEEYNTQPDAIRREQWLPYVVQLPAFDPLTQKLSAVTTTIEATRVLVTATVIALNSTDIDIAKTANVEAMSNAELTRAVFLVLFDHENRIRALRNVVVGATPQITIAQAKAGMKALL